MCIRDRLRYVEIRGTWGKADNFYPPLRGKFHRWGEKLNYVTDGHSKLYGAAEVVAIVEAEDGHVYEVPVDKLQFLIRPIPSEYDDILTR